MFVKLFFQPKIIALAILYSIVAFSWWPFIIWAGTVLFIGFAEVIIYIKDLMFTSSSFRNAPVTVQCDEKNSNEDNGDSKEIDWSKFDLSKYPKVNYRKIYWEHKPFVSKGVKYKYPYADIIMIIYILICVALSYVEWILNNYSLMRVLVLSFVLLMAYYIYIPYGGKKFYEYECKEEFKYYYNKQ